MGEGFIIVKVDIAALLALVGAVMSGIGDVVRQRSAQEITDEQVGHGPADVRSPVAAGAPSRA